MYTDRSSKFVTARIGSPEVGKTHKLVVGPSSSGSASHRPSGESAGMNINGRTRELMTRARVSDGPSSGAARRISISPHIEWFSVTVARFYGRSCCAGKRLNRRQLWLQPLLRG